MIYFLEGDRLEEQKTGRKNEVDFRPCLALLNAAELEAELDYLQPPRYFTAELFSSQSCKFEGFEGFNCIALSIPDTENLIGENDRIAIYYRSNLLIIVYEDERGKQIFDKLLHAVSERGMKNLSLERILFEFFDQLTNRDSARIEEIEQEVFRIEEALLEDFDDDYIKKIIDVRRRLLVLKRYYEQLLEIAEGIEENENELFSKGTVTLFRMFTKRADRLVDGVINLRDYVSQVREAYQAQMDIRQNEIMKLFTVITAIFLPLTLLVGWYGMNLQMPEFHWAYAYPGIILVSLAIAVGCIFYFKKNKWF